jgi:hypothetical protein
MAWVVAFFGIIARLAQVRIAKVGKRGFSSCRVVPSQVRASISMPTASHVPCCAQYFLPSCECVCRCLMLTARSHFHSM